jgi:hypothetical protein
MVGMVSGDVFGVGVAFGSLQDGEAGFSFVGCFFWVDLLRVMVMVMVGLPLWVVFLKDFLRVRMRVILPAKSLCGMGLLHGSFGSGWRFQPSSH